MTICYIQLPKSFLKNILLLPLFLLTYLNVSGQITADFSANKVSGCAPFIVKITDLSTGMPNSWKWTSTAGVSSDKQNPTLIFPNPGVYSITLEVSDGSSTETVTKQSYIRVLPGLTVDFSVFQEKGCAPYDVTINDLSVPQSSPIVDWFWSFENGQTSTDQNPTVTFDKADKYDVLLKITDANGCEASLNKEDFIEISGPKADFLFDSVVCSIPADIIFLNTSTGTNLAYEWDFGNGQTSTQAIPSAVNYNQHDTLQVTLKVQEQGTSCKDSITKTLYIRNYEPLFDVSVICTDTNFWFTVTDKTIPTPQSVLWNFGDGFESTLKSLTHGYSDKNEKTLTLTTRLSSSCVNSKKLTYKPPVASFSANAPLDCQSPFPVDFTNQSTGLELTYLWNFKDSIFSTDTNPSYTYTIPPVSFRPTLTVTDQYSCSANTARSILVPKPLANITTVGNKVKGCAPLTINFIDSVTNVQSPIKNFTWTFGDPSSGSLNTSTIDKPAHVYNSPGKYDVTFIVELENGCFDTIVRKEFIAVGTIPDNIDFNINFSDTICYNNSLDFIGLTGYNNPSYTADFFCWSFEEGPDRLMTGNENPPADCPSGPSGYLPTDKTVHTQNPNHLYANYEYENGSSFGGNNYLGQIKPEAGLFYTHLVSGFNGCYDEVSKPIYIYPTAAMPGFSFGDADETLSACDTNKTIGIYNASVGYDSLVYFHIIHIPTNDTVLKLNDNDTIQYKFNRYGSYAIQISVYSNVTKCTDAVERIFQVLENKPMLSLKSEFCRNQEFLTIDSSVFSKGKKAQRIWFVNGFIDNAIFLPRAKDDSLQISLVDTGWNYIESRTVINLSDSLFSTYINQKECFFSVTDSIYIHGIEFELKIDTNLICGKDSAVINNNSFSTSGQKSIEWTQINPAKLLSNTDNYSFQINTPGSYQFQAKIESNFGCIDSGKTETLLVSLPLLGITPSDTIACESEIINFNNNSISNNGAYTWTIENTNYFNIDAVHQFNNPGKFDVKLHAIDKYNCQDSVIFTDTIRIAPFPDATFEALDLSANCPPFSIQFIDTSLISGTNYEWKVNGSNFSTNQNYLHTFIKPGKYDIEFTALSAEGCSKTTNKSQYITIKGPQVISSVSKQTSCVPDSISFYMDFIDTEYYVWDYGDGTIQSNAVTQAKDTSTHYYTYGAVFEPQLTIIDSNECSIQVDNMPEISVDSLGANFANEIACTADSLQFINQSRGSFSAQYTWDFGDGTTVVDSLPVHSYAIQNTYDVRLIMESSIGCLDTITKQYTVFQNPKETLSVTNKYFCVPVATTYELQYSNPLIVPQNAYFKINGTTINGNTATYDYTNEGIYNLSYHLEYGNGVCKIDSFFNEKYYLIPTSDFDFSPSNNSLTNPLITFENNSTEANSYLWNFGDNSTATNENTLHTYNSAKNYAVKLLAISEGGCRDSITKNIPIAPFDLIKLPNAFSPNGDGYNDEFGILFAGDMTILSFEIYNRWGNLLFQTSDINEKWDGKFKDEYASPGPYIYFVRGQLINGESKEYKGDFTLIR